MADLKAQALQSQLLQQIYGSIGLLTGGDGSQPGSSVLGQSINNQQVSQPIQGIGKEAVHTKYPNEVEYFAVAIELVDSQGNSNSFFSFPLMPNDLRINTVTNSNVTKTLGGVVVNTNPSFNPFSMSMNGNFGKKFRKIMSNTTPSTAKDASGRPINDPSLGSTTRPPSIANAAFSTDYKNGYGNVQMLYSLLEKSKTLDKYQRPYLLVFYNITFNQIYVVEYMPGSFYVNKEMNGIFQYSLTLTAVAPAYAIFNKTKINSNLKKILDYNKLSNKLNNQSRSINNLQSSIKLLDYIPVHTILTSIQRSTGVNIYGTNAFRLVNTGAQGSNPFNTSSIITNNGNQIMSTTHI